MRRFALLVWVLAFVLALIVVWQARTPVPVRAVTALLPAPELLLWQQPENAVALPVSRPPAVPMVFVPVASQAPDAPPVAAMVKAGAATPVAKLAACARLGIFPDADWASQVGQTLMPTASTGMAWTVKAYPGRRYYVVFTGIDADELSRRLVERKVQLRRRVSAFARPEACS